MADSLPPHGQAPLFMENFREEYWSRLPFPPPAQSLISYIDRQAPYHQDHLGSSETRAKGQQRQRQVIRVQSPRGTSVTFKQNEEQRGGRIWYLQRWPWCSFKNSQQMTSVERAAQSLLHSSRWEVIVVWISMVHGSEPALLGSSCILKTEPKGPPNC